MPLMYDVVVIGGGVHGCASAALAAASGLTVLLVEKNDLASATSSASSKLIHGGLRYLEQGEFRLVHEALRARQTLLKLAPHLVHPLAFVLPFTPLSRPKWQVRIGLACYDFFATHTALPKNRLISQANDPFFFTPFQPAIQHAALYFDAQAEDTRLTIENALQAKQFGASIQTHTTLTHAEPVHNHWSLTLSPLNKKPYTVEAKTIVNTAGPWVNEIHRLLRTPHYPAIRWVKGSHIVLPTLYPGKHAYILQHQDKRVVFCLPYHGHTVVGTTDEPTSDLPNDIQMSHDEVDYLASLVSQYFHTPFQPKDILHHWSGVRTLIDDPKATSSALSRNTVIHYASTQAPVVSLYGGKLTTHQATAQALLQALKPVFPGWQPTVLSNTPFPGAQCPASLTYATHIHQLKQDYTWLPPSLLQRYLMLYGTRITALLQGCNKLKDLGPLIAPTLYSKEIQFLCEEEWATHADDILWRRTKLGLTLSQQERETVLLFIK
ncbi:MAG: glycerol-3-phosphate dehydrogenase [Gammaproteobacteria bacterium]|nr:glycerol-3-phosphate dehydrogenase [Gammaproteobacteria bacterium]